MTSKCYSCSGLFHPRIPNQRSSWQHRSSRLCMHHTNHHSSLSTMGGYWKHLDTGQKSEQCSVSTYMTNRTVIRTGLHIVNCVYSFVVKVCDLNYSPLNVCLTVLSHFFGSIIHSHDCNKLIRVFLWDYVLKVNDGKSRPSIFPTICGSVSVVA